MGESLWRHGENLIVFPKISGSGTQNLGGMTGFEKGLLRLENLKGMARFDSACKEWQHGQNLLCLGKISGFGIQKCW